MSLLQDFFSSWNLFANAYLSGLFAGVALSLVGVFVVGRDQIFLGAALAQASTLGIACCVTLGAALGRDVSDRAQGIAGMIAAVVAAFLATRRRRLGRALESVIGVIFVGSGAFAMLLLARNPHGMEELHHLASSTIIGAREADVIWCGAALVALTLLIWWKRDVLLLITIDPEMAHASGISVPRWELLLWGTVALLIGYVIKLAGVVFVFSVLILPALSARNMRRTMVGLLYTAPLIASISLMLAFIFANSWDLPPAQVGSALLCLSYSFSVLVALNRSS